MNLVIAKIPKTLTWWSLQVAFKTGLTLIRKDFVKMTHRKSCILLAGGGHLELETPVARTDELIVINKLVIAIFLFSIA